MNNNSVSGRMANDIKVCDSIGGIKVGMFIELQKE